MVAVLLLSSRGLVTASVMWLFLAAPWIRLQCVIVVFPDHSHLISLIKVASTVLAPKTYIGPY